MSYTNTKCLLHTEQKNWITQTLSEQGLQLRHIVPLAEHADTRRYLRLHTNRESIICLQTTGTHDLPTFIEATLCLSQQSLPTPSIIAHNTSIGIVLLTDLGDDTLLKTLRKQPQKKIYFYEKALHLLQDLQKATYPKAKAHYDEKYARANTQLCQEWFCEKLTESPFTPEESTLWQESLDTILADWDTMPTALCHRDFHADNIMVAAQENTLALHILDYQDLSTGPYLYDLVSLSTDHYLPLDQGVINYLLSKAHPEQDIPLATQKHWHRCLAIQRHLKNLGVFARLALKSGKKQYLLHLPRMLHHMQLLCPQNTALPRLIHKLTQKWCQYRLSQVRAIA